VGKKTAHPRFFTFIVSIDLGFLKLYCWAWADFYGYHAFPIFLMASGCWNKKSLPLSRLNQKTNAGFNFFKPAINGMMNS